jgi:hypothetical protein
MNNKTSSSDSINQYYSPNNTDSDSDNQNYSHVSPKYHFFSCHCKENDTSCLILCFNHETNQFESIDCMEFRKNMELDK